MHPTGIELHYDSFNSDLSGNDVWLVCDLSAWKLDSWCRHRAYLAPPLVAATQCRVLDAGGATCTMSLVNAFLQQWPCCAKRGFRSYLLQNTYVQCINYSVTATNYKSCALTLLIRIRVKFVATWYVEFDLTSNGRIAWLWTWDQQQQQGLLVSHLSCSDSQHTSLTFLSL